MVNRSKYQLEVCKAMLDKKARVRGCALDDENYAVTFDGFTSLVICAKDAIFDISKIQKMEGLKSLYALKENDIEVSPTKELRDYRYGYLAKLASEDGKVIAWVKNALLKDFSGYKFYTSGPLDRVIVMDGCGALVGVVLPVRVKS